MKPAKNNALFIVSIVAVVLLILLMAWKVRAAEPYGIAEYYRSDAWGRSGLKAHWLTMDVGVRGDVLQGDGDFEKIWTGAEGGCTDCMAEWACECTYAGGDVNQETTYLYSRDTSVKLDATGFLHSLIYHAATYEANKCYLAAFCYRGHDGTEDLLLYAGNSVLTDSYNFATDVWSGAHTDLSLVDIGTSWTCGRAFINVGTAAKSSYVLAVASDTADGIAIYIDYVRLYELRSCEVNGQLGNALTVNGDPLFGHSEVLMPRVGTGPAGDWGMGADGVDDFVKCADATCAMDPILWNSRGPFSVGCRLVADTVVAGTDYIISKYATAGAQRSWQINRNTTSLSFIVSDDGTNFDTNTVVMFVVGALHSFVSTFDSSGGPGACVNNLYYDANQVDTDATMTECAPFNSTADLQVGALSGGSTWDGSMLECALWDGVLSAVQANKWQNPYYPGNANGDGFFVHTCSQASSHDVCSTQKCRAGAPNTCQAEGTGVMACYGPRTERNKNNSWETFAGGDDNPNYADWVGTELGGGLIRAYRADTIHGDVAARFTTTGTATARVQSDCITVNPNTTYDLYLKARRLVAGPVIDFILAYYQYSDGACSNQVSALYGLSGIDFTEVWTEYETTFTTLGTANSLRIQFPYNQFAADYLIDAVSIKEAGYRTPWVHNPSGAGTTSYTARDDRLDNPLARYVEAEAKKGYEDGWCVSACVYTDHTTDGTVHRALTSGTVTNQFWSFITNDGSDNISFAVTTGVGAWKSIYQAVTPSTWVAGTRKFFTGCTDNANPSTLTARWYETSNSTWYAIASPSSGGGSTGQMTTQSDELHIGHQGGSDFLGGYVIGIWLSEHSAIFPLEGFEECKNFSQPPY